MHSVATWCCGFDPEGILRTAESGEWLQPFLQKVALTSVYSWCWCTGELYKIQVMTQTSVSNEAMRQWVTDSELPGDINIYKQTYAHQYVLEGLWFQFVIHL